MASLPLPGGPAIPHGGPNGPQVAGVGHPRFTEDSLKVLTAPRTSQTLPERGCGSPGPAGPPVQPGAGTAPSPDTSSWNVPGPLQPTPAPEPPGSTSSLLPKGVDLSPVLTQSLPAVRTRAEPPRPCMVGTEALAALLLLPAPPEPRTRGHVDPSSSVEMGALTPAPQGQVPSLSPCLGKQLPPGGLGASNGPWPKGLGGGHP
ncbi:uncharacterized protein LOC130832815 [Hippopotamus amphibius kiboko]|uniref:uncharacterized protein LOC130832815 n=1 Tax=Hippopotamus amphibius kiboko TaxID=575201 RepID=UPI00259A9DBC|nr:uncharacterized protein LOC130832815 [Hippopotamus amphibius kiboko]